MNAWFADTFFFLALVSRHDEAHEKAVAIAGDLKNPIVTTAWILTEVADALASPATRVGFGNV